MKFIVVFLFLFAFIFPMFCFAQSDSLYEALSESIEEDNGFAELIEELHKNPINLNSTSREDLEIFPFLSKDNIDSLITHRPYFKKNQVRKLLNKEAYKLFRPFFVLKPPVKAISIKVIQRMKMPLNKTKGLQSGKFLGGGFENYSRIRFNSGENLSGGLLSQKDYGEKDFFDHYSGFIKWNDLKNKYILVMGNYQVQFGHGLVFSSPYSIQKSVFALATLRLRSFGGRPFLSSSESSGFTGLYAHYGGLNYVSFDLFYSESLRDATFDKETLLITGLDYAGYHRTESEISKIDLIKEKLFGGHIKIYPFNWLNLGLTYAKVKFNPDITFNPDSKSGNDLRRDFFHFNGNQINLYSGYFSTQIGPINFNGEIAGNSFSHTSHSYSLLFQEKGSGIGLKWWYIPANFQSPFGRSFASSTAFPQAKEGYYIGGQHQINDRISFTSYWTIEKQLWRSYFDPLPTSSKDYLFNLKINIAKKTDVSLRYQFSQNQQYTSATQNCFHEYRRKFRIDLIKHISKNIRVRSRVEKVFINYSLYFSEKQGINLYQDIRWQITPFATISARYSSFETFDYNSRIYEFENDIPGTFSNYALSGKGSKWYLLVKLNIINNLRFWIKYRAIYYDGIETIGSGDMQTEGNTRQDVRIQFSYQY